MLKLSNQMIEGFVEINAHQKQPYFFNRFQSISKELSKIFVKDQTLQAGNVRLTEILVAVVMVGLIFYSVFAELAYEQTLLLLGYYAVASYRVVPSIKRILTCIQQILTHEYLVDEIDASWKKHDTFTSPANPVSFQDNITFQNVSFRYPHGSEILKNVSFTVRKGEKIAIVGASGAGKSSLLLLILGFLRPTEGQLLIDGKDIGDQRSLVGYVAQSPYILDGTILENIAIGDEPKEVDRNRILQVMRQVDLYRIIEKLPNGIDTRIGERGAMLSGGQRQRLSLARSLFHDQEILLLDEVTNQLDRKAESEMIDIVLGPAGKVKTVIMVTHQSEHLQRFDSVYHLNKGTLSKLEHLVESSGNR